MPYDCSFARECRHVAFDSTPPRGLGLLWEIVDHTLAAFAAAPPPRTLRYCLTQQRRHFSELCVVLPRGLVLWLGEVCSEEHFRDVNGPLAYGTPAPAVPVVARDDYGCLIPVPLENVEDPACGETALRRYLQTFYPQALAGTFLEPVAEAEVPELARWLSS